MSDQNFAETVLGTTGLKVGRLGLAASYGGTASDFEYAFERGCNYFYHGSFRRGGMRDAIRNITAAGQRDKLITVAQVYTRWPWWIGVSLERFLRLNRLDYADVLLLGWYGGMPWESIMKKCEKLKEQGKYRFLAVSGHNRPAFPEFARSGKFDILHLRYNAVHRGAEQDIFPHLAKACQGPGIVSYTTTAWRKLINPALPEGMRSPTAVDAYRFALTNPDIDVAMCGFKDRAQLEENLTALEKGPMDGEELEWMRRVGDILHR